MKCKNCNNTINLICSVPNSYRGSKLYVCKKCDLIQTLYSKNYNQLKDPHSTKFKGTRLVTISSGSRWGNVRHGKELRFNAHKNIVDEIFKKNKIKKVFDDGANRGTFAEYCQKKKIYYNGCEPDKECFQNYKNFKIKNCTTEKFTTKLKFDFIYSAHTLEHVENLNNHLKKINSLLVENGIFFLEIPNSNQIFYSKKIYEEYFIDKHLNHFTPSTILKILEKFGFFSEKIISNQYNIIIIFRKKNKIINKNKKFENYLNLKDIIKAYYLNRIKSINEIKQISKRINILKKNKSAIFFGAGRILNTFFENGLNTKNVKFLIDNFLSGKIKSNHNLRILNSDYLIKKNYKNFIIFIFARNAEDEIYSFLKKKKFKSVIKISDLFR